MKQPVIQPSIAREALCSSPYRPLFQQATEWLGMLGKFGVAAGEGPAACTPAPINPAAVIAMERVAIEIAALANGVTNGSYDLPGALDALKAIAIRAGTIAGVAELEVKRSALQAAKPVGSA